MITLERLKEVQAQAEAAKVRVAEADALDAAVQLMEDLQVASPFCMVVATSISSVPPASQKKDLEQQSRSSLLILSVITSRLQRL